MNKCKICNSECSWVFCTDCEKLIGNGIDEMEAERDQLRTEREALLDLWQDGDTALDRDQADLVQGYKALQAGNRHLIVERDRLRTELDAARKQMSDIEQALHTVNILNNELYAQYDEVDSSFLVVTDGHAVRIDFDTIPVWCIVRDGREYIEDTGELVDFTYMIRKRFNGIVERLAGFKFNLSDKEV